MRFLFTSIRGQGHTRPLLPFARGLSGRGHEVRVASPEDTRPMTDKAGLTLAPFDRMRDEEIQAQWTGRQHLEPDEMARVGIQEMFANKTARAAIPKLTDTLVGWRPDVVIRDSAEFAAFVLCEKLGIPHARVGVHNCVVEASILHLAEEPVDALLSDLGAARQKGSGLWSEPAFSMFPAGFDGEAEHGADNPPMRVKVAGSTDAPETDWKRQTDLPLVYMSFGTVAGGDLFGFHEVYEMAVQAAAGLEAEVLLTTGPNIDPASLGTPPDNMVIRSFVPQAAVLKEASAVMHHCGSGTLLGAFEAGVPMVVVPLFADQPWNAERVEAAGLGLAVTDRSAEAMRDALRAVLGDNRMAERNRRIAEEMASLPGLDAALDAMEKLARPA